MEVRNILWFRHGLRLHDNPALLEALKSNGNPVTFYPVYIFDGENAGTKTVGYNPMKFLLECLVDLDEQFRELGSQLWVFSGKPSTVFRKLHEKIRINKICFEKDCEPIYKSRDQDVENTARQLGISIVEKVSHTLYNPLEIIKSNGGFAPLTYEMFQHTINVLGFPPRPKSNADFSQVKFGEISKAFFEELSVLEKIPSPEYFSIYRQNSNLEVQIKWIGGERKALEQLEHRLKIEEEAFKNGTYLPNQANVNLLDPPTSLSAAIRFGCLSVRLFYASIHDKFKEVQDKMIFKAPTGNHITSQLIWREYFYTMSVNNPRFGQMKDNPICLEIPWRKAKDEDVLKWKEGKTGIPIIDASLRQLLSEGWIHHTLRNITATFLTRTGLFLSWEFGFQHFLDHLLDADWSVCAGNWMWVSSSAFEKLLDSSKCSIIPFGQRLDPKGDYIKRYIPELRNLPEKFIHQPWLAPREVQEEHKVYIGQDIGQYPLPMLDLTQAMHANCKWMKSIRESIVKKPHLRPSNEHEIRNFFWIADDVTVKCS